MMMLPYSLRQEKSALHTYRVRRLTARYCRTVEEWHA